MMKGIDFGDRIEVVCAGEKYKGIMIPRPQIFKKGFIVLKLDNGYNIGIDEKKISKINTLKKRKEKKKSHEKLKVDPKIPTVSFISIGGTISSRVDYHTGGVYSDYTGEDFVDMCPELKGIANLKVNTLLNVMSEDINNKHWKTLTKAVCDSLNDKEISGVVITMGTDMLHYTSAALSFFIKNINKPVIITGAQRSIDRGSSDAFMNMICSVITASSMDFSGVATCLHGTTNDDYCLVIRGTKARKMHTSRRDAFRPINDSAIAFVYPDGKIEMKMDVEGRNQKRAEQDFHFDEKTGMVTIYPDFDPDIIDFFVKKKYNGLVIAATALGHVPTNGPKSLMPALKRAISSGMIIVISTQTLYGRTHPYVYTNLRKLSVELDCVFAEDMLPETAYVKLAWALGKDKKNAKKIFMENISGEINLRHDDKFLI